MEGTSGAADLGPLRGGTGDAALGGTAEGASQGAPPRKAQRRSLQPVGPRFHDERCPSGSGWGKTLLRSPARAMSEERPPSEEGRPWPVKTRLATIRLDEGHPGGAQARPGGSEEGRRGVATRGRCRGRHCHARLRSRVPVRSASLAKAGPASGARERTFELPETGIRRSCGRARGLWWLQKSTSGAWS